MKNIQTEVYRLPGAGFAEKDGTFVNSARWLQWKWAALPPPGDAKLDQEILARIFLRSARAVSQGRRQIPGSDPEPRVELHGSRQSVAVRSRARINGRALADVTDPATKQIIKAGQQLPGFAYLRDDGSTACGNWIW